MKLIVKCKKWIKKTTLRPGHTSSNTATNVSSASSSVLRQPTTTTPPPHDWRMLSPDQPPLPTFFSHADTIAVTPGAALAPMFEHRPFAFTPLTTHQTQHHRQQQQQTYHPLYTDFCSRPLNPILEENELFAMTSDNRTSAGDSPLTTETIHLHQMNQHHRQNLFHPTTIITNNCKSSELQPFDPELNLTYPPASSLSSSSLSSPSPLSQQEQSNQPRHSKSGSSSSNNSCNLPPPTVNTTWHHLQRQSFDSDGSSSHPPVAGNELYCKRKFSKMVQATHQFQNKPNIPSTMQVIFQGDHINAINWF
ncbi:unnamed protein product [Absidia cylindrospora]